jgi:hypothetical protein
VNETTRLYTRDGIKTIDYEVYLKLQKHCEELEHRTAKQMIMVQSESDACKKWMDIAQDNDQLYMNERYKNSELKELVSELTERLKKQESWKDKWQDSWIALNKRYQVLRDALKTIKHTDCDTYKVSSMALFQTANHKGDDPPVIGCDNLDLKKEFEDATGIKLKAR